MVEDLYLFLMLFGFKIFC